MDEHFLLVSGCGWGWVVVYSGWVGVGEHFLWVNGGGWRYILGGCGWVGVSGDEWSWSLVLV